MFLKYQLRKPFSRKIRLDSKAMIKPSGARSYFDKYAPIIGKDPLAGALSVLTAIYGNDFDAADTLMDQLIASAPSGAFTELFQSSDLRKFMMAMLRDYYAEGNALDGRMAEKLQAFSASFDPQSRHVFEPDPHVDADIPLREFEYETNVPSSISIAIYFRSKFYPTSRPHDLAYRFKTAFEGAGARSEIIEPDKDPDRIVDCDIALVDDPHVFRKSPDQKRQFLERVRERSKCMAMIEMDPWTAGLTMRAEANKDLYDVIWAMMPSLIDSDGKIGETPASCMLFPVGAPDIFARHGRRTGNAGDAAIKFCGGIEEYNFYRYFWVIGALSGAHPPIIDVTNHSPDDKSVSDSLDDYVARLASSYACLNFIRRASGESSIVGRTSDALCLSQLLVQEASVEVSPYLTPGEHFVQFSSIEELEEVCGRLMHDRTEFEEIRNSGAALFNARYSDAAVLRHLATWLN